LIFGFLILVAFPIKIPREGSRSHRSKTAFHGPLFCSHGDSRLSRVPSNELEGHLSSDEVKVPPKKERNKEMMIKLDQIKFDEVVCRGSGSHDCKVSTRLVLTSFNIANVFSRRNGRGAGAT